MSIWKDLLFLGGHIATPAGLAEAAPEATQERRQPARRERAVVVVRPNRVSPSEYGW